jgi:hypothetical protein
MINALTPAIRFAVLACLFAVALTQAQAGDDRRREPGKPSAPPAASEQPHRPHLYNPSMQGMTADSNAAKNGVSFRGTK